MSLVPSLKIVGSGSGVTRPAADLVTRRGDSLNGGMTHFPDVLTGICQLSISFGGVPSFVFGTNKRKEHGKDK